MFELIPWRRRGTSDLPVTFGRLRRDFDDLIERFFEPEGFFGEPWSGKKFMPAVDISEDENEIVVKAEIPGIDQKDLEIDLTGDVLTIKGEKKEEKREETKNVHRLERSYGYFTRSFGLPCEVESEKVEAKYKDGVLSLKLPKADACKRKSTKITVH